MIEALVRGVARALAALPRPLAALAAVAWMALIYVLSSGPRDLLPSGWLFQTLNNAAHGPVYGVLALLAARAAEPRARAPWIGLAVAIAYGATDEWHQSLVPGRSASVADWITDATGSVGALWLVGSSGDLRASRRRAWIVATALAAAASLATLADRLG